MKTILALLLSFVAFTAHADPFDDYLKREAAGLTSKLPVTIDEYTSLVAGHYAPETRVFSYTYVAKVSSTFVQTIATQLKADTVRDNCNNPGIRKWLDAGVVIRHTYYGNDGIRGADLRVAQINCLGKK